MAEAGDTYLPAAAIGVLLLGPGTRITHQAMNLLGESGVSVCWVGEGGTRLYASAPSLSRSTKLLEAQARLVSNRKTRLGVARSMYQMRFPGEDVSRASMQRLRGMEGARIRRAYRRLSEVHGVSWNGRHYDPNDYSGGDPVNRALSTANAILYGVCHTVVAGLGCSPGLGFVHTGHSLSFIYDIADLYKVETSFPVAFELAASSWDGAHNGIRRLMRERIHDLKLFDRVVSDLHSLLLGEVNLTGADEEESVQLFDEVDGSVAAGVDYSELP